MAKLIYVCVRNQADVPAVEKKVSLITRRLVPDNIPEAECKTETYGNIIYGITTYSKTIAEYNGSVCMGVAYPCAENWWQPLATPPDGAYGIFRCNDDYVQAITDFAGSRSIWYYKDENIFIAGTSQRAVIAIAGKFELNKKVLPWILSAGSLGHLNSWSTNVKCLAANASVVLNRKTWELSTTAGKVEFKASQGSDKEVEENLRKVFFESFKNINTDFSQWILPLSGGYDSRAIACILKESGSDISQLETITWGTRASLNEKDTDGHIGMELAKAMGLKNRFCETDRNTVKETIETVFERFINCGEGRIDHILGYMDGFAIWKDIFYSGKLGVIRGDETLGAPEVSSYLRARLLSEIKLCTDFGNLEDYESYGFEKQELPPEYQPQPGETPGTMRDRVYQEYRMPNILPALSDLKFGYTEILNPFLSRAIVGQSRTLPDHLRMDRTVYKKILDSISPNVPYAVTKGAHLYSDILTLPEAVQVMTKELSADYMKDIFPAAYVDKILGKLQKITEQEKPGGIKKVKAVIQRNMPVSLKEILRKNLPKPTLDNYRIAFRMYMTGKVYKMINEDVKFINNQASIS